MNVYDKIMISAFLYAVIVWQALHQADLFSKDKTISHFWEGVWYSLAVLLVSAPYIALYDWWYALKVPAIGVSIRAALFDITLNRARGYAIFYNGAPVTVANADKDVSKIDEWENKLPFRWQRALKISYIIIFIIVIFLVK